MTPEERDARRQLAELPMPLNTDSDLGRERARIARVAAEHAAERGAPDELLELLYEEYRAGGSAIPWLRKLLDLGHRNDVALRARIRARVAERLGEDAEALAALAKEAALTDGDWELALADFAVDPTRKAWEAFMRFCPSELQFERTQQAVLWLRSAGADPDRVYLAIAPWACTSELTRLVEDGLVDPKMVEASLDEVHVSPTARGMTLMSAAIGAQRRGNSAAVVRLVEASWATGAPADVLDGQLQSLREEADETLLALLEQ